MPELKGPLKIVSDVLLVVGGMFIFLGFSIGLFALESGDLRKFTIVTTLIFLGAYVAPALAGLALIKISNLMQTNGNVYLSPSRPVSIWILSLAVVILFGISITIFVINPRG